MKFIVKIFKCLSFIIIFPLAGCSAIGGMNLFSENRKLSNLIIFSDEKMNESRPLSVDMVWIKDKTTHAVLSNIDSTEWFAKRNDFKKIYAGKITFLGWEVVPGQVIQENLILQSMPKKSYSIMVFANYNTEYKNAYELPNHKNVKLKLGNNSFQISEFFWMDIYNEK